MLTQARERDALQWAQDFSQFIEALQDVMPIDPRWLPPQTVVMFGRERDFRPFQPARPDGKRANVAGFFARRESWAVVGLPEHFEDEDLRQTVYHEGVHWFMSAAQVRLPMWFDEGVAEVFSTFQVEKNIAKWGRPLPWHVALLQHGKLLPMERLVWMGREDPLFNESSRTTLFYAQSWLFVHYLLFGKREGSPDALNAYFELARSGGHPDEVFKQAFGTDYAGMDRELERYLRKGKFFMGSKPAPASDLGGARFEKAEPAAVEVALARLALGGGRSELARQHADRAVELAPDSADAWATLAAVHVETESPLEEQKTALRHAVGLGAGDGWCRATLALLEVEEGIEQGGILPPRARHLANNFERAINERPLGRTAYIGLAQIAGLLEQVSAEDVKFLEQGRHIFPDEAFLSVGLAQLTRKRGDREAAKRHLATALAQPGRLTAGAFAFARALEPQWRWEEAHERAQAAATEGRFTDAVRELEALRSDAPSVQARQAMVQLQRELQARDVLRQAVDAGNAGRVDEARALLEQVAEATETPPHLKREARRLMNLFAGAGSRPARPAPDPN